MILICCFCLINSFLLLFACLFKAEFINTHSLSRSISCSIKRSLSRSHSRLLSRFLSGSLVLWQQAWLQIHVVSYEEDIKPNKATDDFSRSKLDFRKESEGSPASYHGLR